MLKARLGEDIFTSWFNALEFDSFDGKTVRTSVPVKFLRNWITSHYSEDLLACCRAEFKGAEQVEVALRQPGSPVARSPEHTQSREQPAEALALNHRDQGPRTIPVRAVIQPPVGRTHVGGFEGSPLDPRYTFESFVVGASNRMAHAGATQVAETIRRREPRLQSSLHSLRGWSRQDAPSARHRLGGETPYPRSAGALSHRRALPLPVRRGHPQPGCQRLQGEVPLHRHAADRRPRVHARRAYRAGIRSHHQFPPRWRPSGRRGVGPPAEPHRAPQRAHALAAPARPRHRGRSSGS